MNVSRILTSPPTERHAKWAIAPLAVAQLIIALDIYIVFVALPHIGRELGFSTQGLQWVVSAYALLFGGFLLLGGRATDLFGRRRLFLAALGLYAVSSLAGGLAVDPAMLIVARGLQGLGGALLFPATLSLINTRFAEGKPRTRALAIWGGAGATGLTLGSLLGGLLTGAFGWPSVFFVNIPLAVATALGALAVIPADKKTDIARGHSFDLPGALTGTAGITLLVYALVEAPDAGWGSASIIASLALAAVLLAGFIVIESRIADPMMPLRHFRNRSLAAATVITLIFGGTFEALPYFLTLLFQNVHAFSAVETGVAFLVPAGSIFAGTQIGERITSKITTRATLLIGFSVGAVGTAGLALPVSANGGYAALVPGLIVMGVGEGITFTGMWVAAAAGVSPEEQGVASGIASSAKEVGYAMGIALLVLVADAGTRGVAGHQLRTAMAHGIQVAIYVSAAALLLGVVTALVVPGKPKAGQEQPADEAAAEPAEVDAA